MHYQIYFETNKLNLHKTWEGIRDVINNKISEQFNKHFCNIAETIQKEVPSAKNNFSDFKKSNRKIIFH